MKVAVRQGGQERTVLSAMITDRAVLGRLSSRWGEGDLFASRWANIVATWCVDYYRNYQDAPKKAIVPLYTKWCEASPDPEIVALIDQFLASLSQEAQTCPEMAPECVLDLAGALFRRVRLSRLRDALEGDLEANLAEEAERRVEGYRRVDLGAGARVNPFNDPSVLETLFQREEEPPLVQYPGALGTFWGRTLDRDQLVAFQCPEKGGKCLDEDTEIVLADGSVRTIREVVESGDARVLSLDEGSQKILPQKVTQFWDSGLKECSELVTRTGRKIVATPDHQFLTPEGWKRLGDIRPGEYVAAPKRLPAFGRSPALSEDEAKFLAYMLADGCMAQTRGMNASACTFSKSDPETVRDFTEVCDRLGVVVRRHAGDKSSYGLSKNARPILRRFGVLGKKSKDKFVPRVVFSSRRGVVAAFLRTFFSCDGSVDKDDTVLLTLASQVMLRQIGHLLNRFGVVHRIHYRQAVCEGKKFDAWSLTISGSEYVDVFFREIGMISYKSRGQISVHSRSFLDKFPWQVAQQMYKEVEEECASWEVPDSLGTGKGKRVRLGHAAREAFGGSRIAGSIREQIAKKCPLMRRSYLKADPKCRTIRKYLESDILWDEVVSVTPVGVRKTYDIGVENTHNFVANDLIVHNSFLLMDISYRAMCQRRKVAYFEAGDLSERQVLRRFLARAARHPTHNPHGDWPYVVKYPVSVRRNEDEEAGVTVGTKDVSYSEPLTASKAREAMNRVLSCNVKSRKPYLSLSVHPNSSLSVAMIRGVLESWAQDDGWVPDVVVVDYADILAPPAGTEKKDEQAQVDATWRQLRRMSQELHCLVLTATQSKATAYGKHTQDASDFSRDKRKHAHVSAMVGINATEAEAEQQVKRLNYLRRRDGEANSRRCVTVAGCLALASPCVLSTF